MFGRDGDDVVSLADPEPHEAGPGTPHLLAEVREGQFGSPRVGDHRYLPGVLVVAHQMLGVVQPRARKPGGTGHRVGGEDRAVRGVRLHLEDLPDRPPEAGEVVH